jgi:hypothetical protein
LPVCFQYTAKFIAIFLHLLSTYLRNIAFDDRLLINLLRFVTFIRFSYHIS